MIQRLIDYLVHQPSITTSPLAVALDNTDLLTAVIVDENPKINLVDTRDQEGNPPLVRLYDTGEIQTLQEFIGGPNRYWIETLSMQIECSVYGPTPGIASNRADYLRMAVEGKIEQVLGTINLASLNLTDLVGSGSYDSIKRVAIVPSRSTKPPMGPGETEDVKWTVSRMSRVEIWVQRTRLKAG